MVDTIRQAADKAVNLGRQLQAVIEVGEFLATVADLDNLKGEAQAAVAKAIAAAIDAKAQLAYAQADVKLALEEAAEARDFRDKARVEADTYSAKIIAEAKDGADTLVRVAMADIAEKQAEADAKLEAAAKEIEARAEGIRNAWLELERVNAVITEAKAKLG